MFVKSGRSSFASVVGFCLLVTALGSAQIAGSGATGTIPVFTGSSAIGNSVITQSGSNVGIGTTTPGSLLEVDGSITQKAANYWFMLENTTDTSNSGTPRPWGFNVAGASWPYASGTFAIKDISANYERFVITPTGNVGIGSTAPLEQLYLLGGHFGITASTNVNISFPSTDYPVMFASSALAAGGGTTPFNFNGNLILQPRTTANGNIVLATGNPSASVPVAERMRVDVNGNVGIGTTSPGATLEVNGTLRFSGDAAGTVQATAWTGVLCGGDYAESVDVSGDLKHYEPGDVLIIDPDHPEGFTKSALPYSIAVAGIYSSKPGVVGRKSTDPDKIKTEIPMAMIGIVPTKVSAENGPIRRGDLLVSSATPGYAMKGTDRSRMLGAVVGKAMGSSDSDKGVIDVLVTLQ